MKPKVQLIIFILIIIFLALLMPMPEPNVYGEYYVEVKVKQGDTLYDIAKRYDSSVNDIVRENMLNNAVIMPEQKLLVPVKERI